MQIIILGAGQVGGSLAEVLVHEDHDITLVDTDTKRLKQLQERLDLQTIVGRCSYPSVLRQAGADDADMVIAVTSSDEINMVACQVAHSLFNTPKKIARIRSQHYFIRKELFGHQDLPIDVFINPEQLVTDLVTELVAHPGALQVLNFAQGRVKLVAVKPFYGGPMVGKPIAEFHQKIQGMQARIAAIFREDHSIPLTDETVIEIGDEVFFLASDSDSHAVMHCLKPQKKTNKRIMIAGGGHIGSSLARALEGRYQLKLIDHNAARCMELANTLSETTVLQGEASDPELLNHENIDDVDVFCAVTNDEEANILSCLQAKKLGAKQVMALINRAAYVDLIEGGGINIAISPQQVTIGSILTHIRRGDVVCVHSLRRGAAEAIELVVHGDRKTSKVIGKPIKKIAWPSSATLGAIIRQDEVLFPDENGIILAGDHVIIFVADQRQVTAVEKLFKVSVGFF